MTMRPYDTLLLTPFRGIRKYGTFGVYWGMAVFKAPQGWVVRCFTTGRAIVWLASSSFET